MKPTISIDATKFSRAIQQYAEVAGVRAAEVVNQSLYDVLIGAVQILRANPDTPDTRRADIRSYMWQTMAVYVRMLKRKKKGKSVWKVRGTWTESPGRGRSSKQLHRVHLIVQANRRKQGKKGLYGKWMTKAAGRYAARAQNSVGYLLVPFKRALMRLNTTITKQEFKFPVPIMPLFHQVAFWRRTGAKGTTYPALRSKKNNPSAETHLLWNFKTGTARARQLVEDALKESVEIKRGKLFRATRRIMQDDANRFNAKKAS